MVIGGLTSFFTFKKTNNILKAWTIGVLASTSTGLLKELVDPLFNQTRNWKDLQFTALGGVIGASIVIPLRSRSDSSK